MPLEQPPPTEVPVSEINLNPGNMRRSYAGLEPLMDSIQRYGILQPPGLWLDKPRGYFVIWGNRRVLCAQKLELPTIWARVFPGPLDSGLSDVYQLIENLQRTDLKPSEEARGYGQLMQAQSLKPIDLAGVLSIAPSTVTKKLALLKLVPEMLERIDAGTLAETAGYELAKLDEAAQRELAASLPDGARREEVSAAIRAHAGAKPLKTASKPAVFKRGAFSISIRDASSGLEPLINECQALIREAKRAQEQGIADCSSFARHLKAARSAVSA